MLGWVAVVRRGTLALGIATLALAACGAEFRDVTINGSHMTRHANPETPATLPGGNGAVLVAPVATTHAELSLANEPVFRMSNIGAVLRARYGFHDAVEGQVEGTMSNFRGRGSECANRLGDLEENSFMGSARAGIKLSPQPIRKFLGFSLGGGVGTGVNGAFAGPDASLVLGFENPYAVPFASVGVVGSIPVNGSSAVIVDCQMTDRIRVTYEPRPTAWVQTTWGIKGVIPEQIIPRGEGVRYMVPMIYVAATINYSGYVSGGLITGIEIGFGKKPMYPHKKRRAPETEPAPRGSTTDPVALPPSETTAPAAPPVAEDPALPPLPNETVEPAPAPKPTPAPAPQPAPVEPQPAPAPEQTGPSPAPTPTPTPTPTPAPKETTPPEADPDAPVIQRPKGRPSG